MSVSKKFADSLNELTTEETKFPSLDDLTQQLQIRSPNSKKTSTNSQPNSNSITTSLNSTLSNVLNVSNYGWKTWVIIILLLALVGVNIFYILGSGSQMIGNVTQYLATVFNDVFGPLLRMFGLLTLETTKQTINVASTGTNAVSTGIANTTSSGINAIEQGALNKNSTNAGNSTYSSYSAPIALSNNGLAPLSPGQIGTSSSISNNVPNTNYETVTQSNLKQKISKNQEDALEKALQNAAKTPEVMPDDSQTSIPSSLQAGWCYIGTDKGTRACAQVGVNDGCMSGEIFPSQAICINPNLRA
jgi:hypothetical protein